MTAAGYAADLSNAFVVDAVEADGYVRPHAAATAIIGTDLRLSVSGLESYFFAQWQPVLVDLLVVAAVAEYCDIVKRRPALGWARAFDVSVAVHDPRVWQQPSVKAALEDALQFLTGDVWAFTFTARKVGLERVRQASLDLGPAARVIMPYSDGLDSRAVASIIHDAEHGGLVRVRLGVKGVDHVSAKRSRAPFTAVPYKVRIAKGFRRESSARSRGFKFAVITGIAARLANVGRIVVTESGQGALGPVIAVSGQAYPDYRVHPAFTTRVERLFEALTGICARYEFPRIWSTKGETLRAASSLSSPPSWHDTRSCWQQSRQTAVAGRRRQCGVCAACLLRRMSMHAANIHEAQDVYVWENLAASEIRDGAATDFRLFTPALEQYAIAGILHLDHLAALSRSVIHARALRRAAREMASALGEDSREAEVKLLDLLRRHCHEWCDFLRFLGPTSFVTKLASVTP